MDRFGASAGYNDANRAFLQAFLARSVLTLETAKPIIAACSTFKEQREVLPQDVTVEDLNDYIADANRKLSPLDLEIRSTFHQQTRERVYALVNTTSDPLTQLATTYTADELVYVKKLLDAIFDGQNNKGKREAMCISGIDAIQVGRAPLRRQTSDGNENATQASAGVLGAKDAENMLHRLLDEGWLEKSRAGFYSLSPRALMELKGWLVDTYNDEDEDGNKKEKIKFCHACKEIITVLTDPSIARANDVLDVNALVEYTISVPRISFESSDPQGVHYAELNGMANILWEKSPSQPQKAIRLEGEGAVQTTDRDRAPMLIMRWRKRRDDRLTVDYGSSKDHTTTATLVGYCKRSDEQRATSPGSFGYRIQVTTSDAVGNSSLTFQASPTQAALHQARGDGNPPAGKLGGTGAIGTL
ncbi:uncharacterized protein Z520_03416 [Fonsecaea multimorphosa CBS 102226]|uniref:Non-structural maintenance of chromosomes element 1 homolog n=1 Tax=Fonsecaea multimorphosa CBS 102226 TaxID=1442371 RepID=A0A0D2HFQ1_9EURO|nr:uncharacterized protein Z520_03416 [Fonsecaea multimorphosa CBS 102226]KIY00751.1 hypothetical protein Z520_03416 [Fonsecaea multimorphosa CBS 102226]